MRDSLFDSSARSGETILPMLVVDPRGERKTYRSRCVIAVAIIALAIAGASCSVVTPTDDPSLKRATAEELTALLRQREASLQSMKGLFSAKLRGAFLPVASRVEGVVYYRRPSALRLRGFLAPVGVELFEFVQSDDLYKLRLPTMGKVLAGNKSDMTGLGKLTRPFQLSVWAMSGVLGNGTLAKGETVKLEEEGDRYRLNVYTPGEDAQKGPRLTRRLWFDRRTLLVTREDRVAQNGEVDAIIEYEDFRPLEDPELSPASGKAITDSRLLRPFKISLEDGHGQGSIQVIFHEILSNRGVRAEDLGEVL